MAKGVSLTSPSSPPSERKGQGWGTGLTLRGVQKSLTAAEWKPKEGARGTHHGKVCSQETRVPRPSWGGCAGGKVREEPGATTEASWRGAGGETRRAQGRAWRAGQDSSMNAKGGAWKRAGGRGLTSASHTFQPPQEGCPGGRNKRKEADVEARPRPEGTALRAGACMLETRQRPCEWEERIQQIKIQRCAAQIAAATTRESLPRAESG